MLETRRPVPHSGLLAQSQKILEFLSHLQLFELFPGFLKYFPGSHRQITKNLQEVIIFIEQRVKKHRETLDSTAPRDYIDAFLIRMDKVRLARGEKGGGGDGKVKGKGE